MNGQDTVETTTSKEKFVSLARTEERLQGLLNAVRVNPQTVIDPLQSAIDGFVRAALPVAEGIENEVDEAITA